MSDLHRDMRFAVTVGVAVAALAIGGQLTAKPAPQDGEPYVDLYNPPGSSAEAMLNRGDGQSFAALAVDPFLTAPERFRRSGLASSTAEAAYRAQRPLFGWLGWLASLGRDAWVPTALLTLTALGAGVLVFGVACAAVRLGRMVAPTVLATIAPGSLVLLSWTGPEGLGTGLALSGLAAWTTHHRRNWAIAAFALAGLSRETLLLFPIGVLLADFAQHRPLGRRHAALAVPLFAWGLWVCVVRLRVDAWPTDAGGGRLAVPLGWLSVVDGWRPIDVGVAVGTAALAVLSVLRLSAEWRVVAAVYVVLAFVMGPDVWKRWEDFSRPLLPLVVLGLVACLPRSSGDEDSGGGQPDRLALGGA